MKRSPPTVPLTAPRWSHAAEWLGASTGMFGAVILSFNMSWSRWGWVAFLVSNLFIIALAAQRRIWGIVVMQLVYTGTSLNGLWHYFT